MSWFSSVSEVTSGLSTGALGLITSTIKAALQPFSLWQERKTEEATAEHSLKLAEYELKRKLVLSEQECNAQWELEALKNKKRSPMQWISFVVLGAPFIIAWVNPALVATYFTVSLQVIPDWYIQLFVSIIGVVWGIAQLKQVASSVKTTLMERRKMAHQERLALTKVAEVVKDIVED